MNRRTFLKSLATACGAAVVCLGELVKSPVKHLWMRGKDGSYIEGERSSLPWKNFYANHNYSQKHKDQLLKEFRTAFENTKFHPPFRILRQ